MFRFLTKITGDDHTMLINDTPPSRKKVALLANALFVPIFLWFISAYAMATNLFGTSWLGGLMAGLTAGTLIFFIDRSIIMAHGNKWIAAFRIIMGLCIATIGSIMVDECLFHDDIKQQFEVNKEEAIKNAKDKINLTYNASILASESNLQAKARIWNEGLTDVKREADGMGGSKKRGAGKITNLKMQLTGMQQTDYNQSKTDHSLLLKEKEIALQTAENKIKASYGNAMLLRRIEALFDLVQNNRIVAFIYFIFTLFIWCLEFLVILFKMNSAETNYERKVNMIEQIGANRIEKIANRDKEWFEAGRTHNSTKNLRDNLGRNPPSFLN